MKVRLEFFLGAPPGRLKSFFLILLSCRYKYQSLGPLSIHFGNFRTSYRYLGKVRSSESNYMADPMLWDGAMC
jgi:hypothetical protein